MTITILHKKTLEIFVILIIEMLFLNSKYLPGSNVGVAFLLLSFLTTRRFGFKIGKLEKIILIYIVYLAFVTALNFSVNYYKQNSIFSIAEYMLIFVCCHTIAQNLAQETFIKYLRNSGLILGCLGIVEGIIQKPFLSYLTHQIVYPYSPYRIVLIFSHPIVSGVFLTICFVALLEEPFKNSLLQFVTIITEIAALIFTRSRSSWLAFAIVLLIFAIKRMGGIYNVNKKILFYILTLLISLTVMSFALNANLLLMLCSYIYNRIKGSLYAGVGQGNIIRVDNFINSFQYWFNGNMAKFFFGMGKNWDKYFMSKHPSVKWGIAWTEAIDNQYITTIHEAGIIGLLLSLSVLIIAIIRAARNKIDNTTKSRIIEFSSLSIVAIFISNYFYEGLNYMSIMTILWILICMNDNATNSFKYLKKE